MIMKKSILLLLVFVLTAGICFFNPSVKQGFAESDQKIKLEGVIKGKGSPNFLEGANWIDVSGDYAYVASYFDNSLSIFDISEPSSPVLAGSIKVQSYEGKDSGVFAVFVSGDYAYIYDANGLFLIYDVSDPSGLGPVLKGKVKIGPKEDYESAKSAWGGVYVQGIIAYVVDEVSDGLTILDVSNKAKPTVIGTISGEGPPNYLSNPGFLTVSEGFAYIPSEGDDALTIIDVSLPTKPVFVATIKGEGKPNYLGGTSSVFIANDYAYVASLKDSALSIIDVINPSEPVFMGSIRGEGKPNYLDGALDVKVVNDYAFVSAVEDNAISVYDVINVDDPVLVDVIKGSGSPNFLGRVNIMDISGSYLYAVSSEDNALVILDISDFISGDEESQEDGEQGENGEVSILRQWLRIYNPYSI